MFVFTALNSEHEKASRAKRFYSGFLQLPLWCLFHMKIRAYSVQTPFNLRNEMKPSSHRPISFSLTPSFKDLEQHVERASWPRVLLLILPFLTINRLKLNRARKNIFLISFHGCYAETAHIACIEPGVDKSPYNMAKPPMLILHMYEILLDGECESSQICEYLLKKWSIRGETSEQ